jgi:hypothetical protein
MGWGRGGCGEGNAESEEERQQDGQRTEHAARIGGGARCGKVSEVTGCSPESGVGAYAMREHSRRLRETAGPSTALRFGRDDNPKREING